MVSSVCSSHKQTGGSACRRERDGFPVYTILHSIPAAQRTAERDAVFRCAPQHTGGAAYRRERRGFRFVPEHTGGAVRPQATLKTKHQEMSAIQRNRERKRNLPPLQHTHPHAQTTSHTAHPKHFSVVCPSDTGRSHGARGLSPHTADARSAPRSTRRVFEMASVSFLGRHGHVTPTVGLPHHDHWPHHAARPNASVLHCANFGYVCNCTATLLT
jgi:hypothetical protein